MKDWEIELLDELHFVVNIAELSSKFNIDAKSLATKLLHLVNNDLVDALQFDALSGDYTRVSLSSELEPTELDNYHFVASKKGLLKLYRGI